MGQTYKAAGTQGEIRTPDQKIRNLLLFRGATQVYGAWGLSRTDTLRFFRPVLGPHVSYPGISKIINVGANISNF